MLLSVNVTVDKNCCRAKVKSVRILSPRTVSMISMGPYFDERAADGRTASRSFRRGSNVATLSCRFASSHSRTRYHRICLLTSFLPTTCHPVDLSGNSRTSGEGDTARKGCRRGGSEPKRSWQGLEATNE